MKKQEKLGRLPLTVPWYFIQFQSYKGLKNSEKENR